MTLITHKMNTSNIFFSSWISEETWKMVKLVQRKMCEIFSVLDKIQASQVVLVVKNQPANAGDMSRGFSL